MNRRSSSMAPLALLAALLVAAAFLLLVKPKRADVEAASADVVAANAQLETTRQAIASLKASLSDPELKALQRQIPRGDERAEFIAAINKLAGSAQIRVTTLTFAEPVASTLGGGSQYNVSLAATGPRPAVDDFLRSLHTTERLTILEQAVISNSASTDGGPDGDGSLTVQVDLSMYTGQTVAVAPVEAPAPTP